MFCCVLRGEGMMLFFLSKTNKTRTKEVKFEIHIPTTTMGTSSVSLTLSICSRRSVISVKLTLLIILNTNIKPIPFFTYKFLSCANCSVPAVSNTSNIFTKSRGGNVCFI
eukprot:TRINITY_DN4119_c0_g1_i1.p1 TRINITY_DN4119_c0_g1~~TRINITY_DN4119_c0_g1_i1.p1  ORF type:complete len:110 (-),score=4.07 TRINITY_DN4119_c0_g1_i1:38-367(-)